MLWQWIVAMRFPLHQRLAETVPPGAAENSPPFQRVGGNRQEELVPPGTAENSPPFPTVGPKSPAELVPSGTEETSPRVENWAPHQCSRPGVTLLKPLKGADEFTPSCVASWFAQHYAGPIQILFGVASAEDPVIEIVRKLISQNPQIDAQLIVCGPLAGTNAKVSKLIQLEKLAKHDLLVISDADVLVPPDLLANIVPTFPAGHAICNMQYALDALSSEALAKEDPRYPAPRPSPLSPRPSPGLVNCFYSLANPSTMAMQWEAIAINVDFWSQVLQAQSIKPIDFALGAVMATTRQQLQAIGGFDAIKNCLADDYQLGHRIAKHGGRIELSTVPVECYSGPMSWRAVWKHQLRWARTIRVSQPAPYFFSILSNPTLWPLICAAVLRNRWATAFAAIALLLRALAAMVLEWRLTRKTAKWESAWLVLAKDLLQVAIWAGAFLGNTIEWRGERMRLLPDGDLVNVSRMDSAKKNL